MLIPVRMGLLGPDGKELPLKLRGWVVCGRLGLLRALACDVGVSFGTLLCGHLSWQQAMCCVSFH